METGFPKNESKYLKPEMFQDRDVVLTYVGWERKKNEDETIGGKTYTAKERLKYILRYTYPQMAVDQFGQLMLNKKGEPFQNVNWHPDCPMGWTPVYFFEEGELKTGSLPLWNEFCLAQPKPGDKLRIKRTGKEKETAWEISVVGYEKDPDNLPIIQQEEEQPF